MKSAEILTPQTFDARSALAGYDRNKTTEDQIENMWEQALRPLCIKTILHYRKTTDLRDYLDVLGIFEALGIQDPEKGKNWDRKLKRTQTWLSKTRKWLGLPPMGKGGARGIDFERAMTLWKDANGEPTDEMILSGWTPIRVSYAGLDLHAAGTTDQKPAPSQEQAKSEPTTPNTPESTPGHEQEGSTPEAKPETSPQPEPETPTEQKPSETKSLQESSPKSATSTAEEMEKLALDLRAGKIKPPPRTKQAVYVHHPKTRLE